MNAKVDTEGANWQSASRAALCLCGMGWLLSGATLLLAGTVATFVVAAFVFVPGGIGALAMGFANVFSGPRAALVLILYIVGVVSMGFGVFDLAVASFRPVTAEDRRRRNVKGLVATNVALGTTLLLLGWFLVSSRT